MSKLLKLAKLLRSLGLNKELAQLAYLTKIAQTEVEDEMNKLAPYSFPSMELEKDFGISSDVIKKLKEEADRGGMGAQSAILKLRRNGINYTPNKQEASGGGMNEKVKEHLEKSSQFMTPQEKAQYKNRPPPPPAPTGGRIKKKRSKKYYSSSDSDSDFRPKRRTNNSALQQLIVANRDKEEKELNKSQLMINRHMAEEIKAIRGMQGPPPKFSGYGIKKLVGTKRGNRARGDIVAEVMKKHGLSLSQASKYVKEHDLY